MKKVTKTLKGLKTSLLQRAKKIYPVKTTVADQTQSAKESLDTQVGRSLHPDNLNPSEVGIDENRPRAVHYRQALQARGGHRYQWKQDKQEK